MEIDTIAESASKALLELLSVATLKKEQILVVGCSTSEVLGKKIGSSSSLDVAKELFKGIYPIVLEKHIYLAVQCCEHLNRTLVVERECMEKYGLEEVCVYPIPKAGGSLAHCAMKILKDPVTVERVQAHAGMDIGDTFIGMHLKPVVIPVRSSYKEIGHAHLTMASTRLRLVGGERARYCAE